MLALKRFAVTVTAALCLMCPLLPQTALAEAHKDPGRIQTHIILPRPEWDTGGEETGPQLNLELTEQIRSTYQSAKQSARVRSFKGKCGAYVSHQLVVLGINTKRLGHNGNRAYDIYEKITGTSGGYRVTAYPAKKFKLEAALEAIAAEDPHARNILVGFERGTSKAGKQYGHVLFIHGIENGMVYFSDSYAQTVDGTRYQEGEPIVCPIETFVQCYRKYKLDGVIHFG